MSAAEILKLIETVSPDDTVKLDEIDALVMQFVYPADETVTHIVAHRVRLRTVPEYTRSRDALKAIRPQGWEFQITNGPNKTSACAWNDDLMQNVLSEVLPTEELAELHAIIQSLEFERNKEETK